MQGGDWPSLCDGGCLWGRIVSVLCLESKNYFNLFPLLNTHPLPPLISLVLLGNTREMEKDALRAFGCS